MEELSKLVQRCEADTRRRLGLLAVERLGPWREHARSDHTLADYLKALLWTEHAQNARRLDQQGGLSIERIIVDHRPDLFSERERHQARRSLGLPDETPEPKP